MLAMPLNGCCKADEDSSVSMELRHGRVKVVKEAELLTEIFCRLLKEEFEPQWRRLDQSEKSLLLLQQQQAPQLTDQRSHGGICHLHGPMVSTWAGRVKDNAEVTARPTVKQSVF